MELAGVMSVPLVSSALALASAGCVGVSNFFGGLASRRTGAMSAVIWMELVGVHQPRRTDHHGGGEVKQRAAKRRLRRLP
jgi:hypothetical protein